MKTRKVDSKTVRAIRFVTRPRNFVHSITVTNKLEPIITEPVSETDIPVEPIVEAILDILTTEENPSDVIILAEQEITNEILTNETPNQNVPHEELPEELSLPTQEIPSDSTVSNGASTEPIITELVIVEPIVSNELPETNSEVELPSELHQASVSEEPTNNEPTLDEQVVPEDVTTVVDEPIHVIEADPFPIIPPPISVQQVIADIISADIITPDLSEEKKFADHLTRLIKNDWRYTSWGYLPDIIIKSMAATNNQFKYKIIKDDANLKNSYIKIISPKGEVNTEPLAIQ